MTSSKAPAIWYFDVISPFAYLQTAHFPVLQARLAMTARPVLLAGLLHHWKQLGPAEIPPKRRQIYRACQWRAEQLGIQFRFPDAHPFNPLRALRLLTALDGGVEAARTALTLVFGEGVRPDEEAGWALLCERLGLAPAEAKEMASAPSAKQALREATEEAAQAGVFGVPTIAVGGELFWGEDATGMLLGFLDDPGLFRTEAMVRNDSLPIGVTR
ncbi:MAG: DsbA family protein [Acetobacteraceae bacterium]|nr:DsbA family protein [Acetobacteraceae bacterium]